MSMYYHLPSLLELAAQSLVENEALAIAALEELPVDIFPPLFMAAYAERCRETLKAMVQVWPFACLPLGVLMRKQQAHQENFQAVLSGLDGLLAQEVRPRRCKLQMLDLRPKIHQNFWAGLFSLKETEDALLMKTKPKMDGSRMRAKQPLSRIEVLVDLHLKNGMCDQLLTSLIRKIKQEKGLLYLHCKKLSILPIPFQMIKRIMKVVQLDSLQELEVRGSWKLSTLGMFAPYLGQMGNLHRLLFSHNHTYPYTSLEEKKMYVNQFCSKLLNLPHLQELCFDSVSFVAGCLNHILRYLRCYLKNLSVTNCLLLESDLIHLSQCPQISKLKDLHLIRVNMTSIHAESLRSLLESTSATLQRLSLSECGITDAQLPVILPALNCCSQLVTFDFCGNPISMAMLKSLRQNLRLTKLCHMIYPTPVESYEDVPGALHLGKLAQLHNTLKWMLHELGRPNMDGFGPNPCCHCGFSTFCEFSP
ncbi:melanoma antigen preferentially expressed in tumors-like isoform X2 [Perognathus longimembris pacificus]|nr:melanoma antigen preferentially expressed in tumors-like isoform X2 [Perognathus longimembris pacificus]XP_048185527.1 melanoma antigen preferentially expressed in tumors-like isoform X2 [Perognathus longimembris pacificus]